MLGQTEAPMQRTMKATESSRGISSHFELTNLPPASASTAASPQRRYFNCPIISSSTA
jgi:hypothetical protein